MFSRTRLERLVSSGTESARVSAIVFGQHWVIQAAVSGSLIACTGGQTIRAGVQLVATPSTGHGTVILDLDPGTKRVVCAPAVGRPGGTGSAKILLHFQKFRSYLVSWQSLKTGGEAVGGTVMATGAGEALLIETAEYSIFQVFLKARL